MPNIPDFETLFVQTQEFILSCNGEHVRYATDSCKLSELLPVSIWKSVCKKHHSKSLKILPYYNHEYTFLKQCTHRLVHVYFKSRNNQQFCMKGKASKTWIHFRYHKQCKLPLMPNKMLRVFYNQKVQKSVVMLLLFQMLIYVTN